MRLVRAAAGGQSTSRHRLSVAVVGLVVSLLGMYAFCTQGTCASGSVCPDDLGVSQHAQVDMQQTPGAAMSMSTSDVAFDGVSAPTVAEPDVSVSAPVTGTAAHDGHGLGAMLAMMCLAVLAVALALLWPVIARTIGFFRLPRLSLTRLVPTLSFWADPGPPVVLRFSVIRC